MVNHPNRKRKVAVSTVTRHDHDADYAALLKAIHASFEVYGNEPLFTTDVTDLNDLYLDDLDDDRQVHNCHACRQFIQRYGGLVAINGAGETQPVMWTSEMAPEFYQRAIAAMWHKVRHARVTGVFMTKHPVLGQPKTGQWTHMAVTVPRELVYRERALTAGQAMAAQRESYKTVSIALTDFKPAVLDEAIRMLTADALARSEKFLAPIKWLRALHDRPKGRRGENILWRAIATAPEGYCHPRASVVGSLLEDIAAGMPFADIKARFDAKLGPLIYQRPQDAPSAGNIKAAEELVAKLGVAPSLERRFARLDELQISWKPAEDLPKPKGGGVFAHLEPKGEGVRPVDLPAVTMTWDKFTRTVLSEARKLEINVPNLGNFIAMTTAVHADAPPIMKWDHETARNPVCLYVYHWGSLASQWGLRAGWAKINAITPFPYMWGSHPMPMLGEGFVLVLDGAVDSRTNSGNALFPECLRAELHGARATIEAYSKSAAISGREEASACGYSINKASAACHLRAFVGGAWAEYRIDRWD